MVIFRAKWSFLEVSIPHILTLSLCTPQVLLCSREHGTCATMSQKAKASPNFH